MQLSELLVTLCYRKFTRRKSDMKSDNWTMWYFAPDQGLEFDFEPVLREIDENEERAHDMHVHAMTAEQQMNYHRTVCNHWLRTLCHKGDHCRYLHQVDRDRMDKCNFWEKYHECSNFDCPFKHDSVEGKDNRCKFYIRGYCRRGNKCQKPHDVADALCVNYLAGFCPEGPDCQYAHAIWIDDRNDTA